MPLDPDQNISYDKTIKELNQAWAGGLVTFMAGMV